MKIGQPFNKLHAKEYLFYIDHYKKYTDFNTLGLYRSLLENEKLSGNDKIAVRDYAHETFKKAFEFLQLKDPNIYFGVLTLGQELTQADEGQLWNTIRDNQQKILAGKKIKHRNFGTYSKHNCGQADCPFPGLMIRQGSPFCEGNMHFNSDNSNWGKVDKSHLRKKNRKKAKEIIQHLMED